MSQPAVKAGIGGTIHIASPHVQVGNQLRQRCAWCGETLLDYDLGNTLSPCDERCKADGCQPEHHRPATWPAGELIEVAGVGSWKVPHVDGDQLPTNACATARSMLPAFTISTRAEVREVPCAGHEDCGRLHHELTGRGHLDCDTCGIHQVTTRGAGELQAVHHEHLRAHADDFAAHGIDITALLTGA